jgi:hypothetical protein
MKEKQELKTVYKTVAISEDAHKKVKVKAALQDKKINALVEELIESNLNPLKSNKQ